MGQGRGQCGQQCLSIWASLETLRVAPRLLSPCSEPEGLLSSGPVHENLLLSSPPCQTGRLPNSPSPFCSGFWVPGSVWDTHLAEMGPSFQTPNQGMGTPGSLCGTLDAHEDISKM